MDDRVPGTVDRVDEVATPRWRTHSLSRGRGNTRAARGDPHSFTLWDRQVTVLFPEK